MSNLTLSELVAEYLEKASVSLVEDQSVIFGRFRAFFQNRMKLAEHQKDVPINIFPSGGKEKLSYGWIWLNMAESTKTPYLMNH